MSRGDGWLFKRPASRFWWMGFYDHGKLVRESTHEIDEKKAVKVLKRRVAQVLADTYVPPARDVQLQNVLERIVADYEARGLRSIATLKFQLRHLRDYFGNECPVSQIDGLRLNRYIADRRKQGAAHNSIRGEIAHLARAFKLSVADRLLQPQQIPAIPILAEDKSRRRQGFLYREQLEELLDELDKDAQDYVEFLFFSGWRKSEARLIEWRDYDRHVGALRLREEISKTKEARILPIVGPIAKIIERRLAKRKIGFPFIFHRGGKKRMGDFRAGWRKAKQAIGKPGLIKHDLRRSSVKHNNDAGVPQKTVMDLAGHRTADMWRRYSVNDFDSLKDAVEKAGHHREQPERKRKAPRSKS